VFFCVLSLISLSLSVPMEGAAGESDDSEDWPMFRLDYHHTGYREGAAPDTNETDWIFDTGTNGRWIVSSAMIVDDYVYIGSDNGKLYKLDVDDGTEVWNYTVSSGTGCMAQFWSSPYVDKENNMVLCHASGVHAIDMDTGERIWHFDTNTREFSSPVVHNGVVFVGTYSKYVYALPQFDPNGDGTISQGEIIWYYEAGEYFAGEHIDGTGGAVSTTMAIADGKVFGAEQTNYDEGNNYCDYNIFALPEVDPDGSGVIEHGEIIWKYEIGEHIPLIDTGIPGDNGDCFCSPTVNLDLGQVYIGSRDQYFYAFALEPDGDGLDNDGDGIFDNEGELLWRYQVDNEIFSSPGIHDGKVIFGSGKYSYSASPGSVYALREGDGGLVWRHPNSNGFLSSPLIADGKVFIGSNDESLYALNAESGNSLWSYRAEGGSRNAIGSSPSLYEERIVVGSCNGMVYSFLEGGSNTPPGINLASPDPGASAPVSPTLKWEGTDTDEGDPENLTYDVYLDTDPNASAMVSAAQAEDFYRASDLTDGETYYWRVVVSDGKSETGSEIWNFTVDADIGNAAPTIYLSSPSDGVTISSTSPVLSYDGSDEDEGDVLTYDVYLDTDKEPAVVVAEDITDESYRTDGLDDGVTYYWKVVVYDGNEEAESETWSFTIDVDKPNTPPVINLTSPPDRTTVPSTSPVISWHGEDDDDGQTLAYDVYLDTDPNATAVLVEGITAESIEAPDLTNGETYYWKVVASDGKNETTSETWSFTVNTSAVDLEPVVTIDSPEEGQELKGMIRIHGTATDDVAVMGVVVRIDGGEWSNAEGANNWEYVWDTRDVENGLHTIEVKAYDAGSESDVASVTVAVNNREKDNDDDFEIAGQDGYMVVGGAGAAAVVVVAGVLVAAMRKKKGSESVSCPGCGGELDFIEDYDSWYCYDCKEYREP